MFITKMPITGNFKISFQRQDSHIRGKVDTLCEIRRINSENSLISSATAHLHPKDKYDKVKGKKVALTKALAKCLLFDKIDRGCFWLDFRHWVNSWKAK